MSEVFEEQRGDARWLTLSSPPGNLLAPDLMAALTAAIKRADEDPTAKAIVLTGAGDVFCGGLDVKRIEAGADPVEFAEALCELLLVPGRLGTPLLGAVNGDALASGFSLVVTTDVAVATTEAKLGTFEASIGIWPMIAQVPPLSRLAPRHALENIITGRPFSAERAREIGAVNEVVAPEELTATVESWIPAVVRAGDALAAGRRSFYRFLDLGYEEALEGGLREFKAMFES